MSPEVSRERMTNNKRSPRKPSAVVQQAALDYWYSRGKADGLIKTTAFQCVSFFDEAFKRQVVILYSLGEDGILREYTGGKWHAYPVTEE